MWLTAENGTLDWNEMGLPMSRIQRDWYGDPLDVPAAFGLAVDDSSLWFVAARESPAMAHPGAAPGEFFPGLWHYDVAEFFLAAPDSGHYLEFNLAPNGAWWSAGFRSPRVPADGEGKLFGVKTYAKKLPGGGWMAASAIPLDVLGEWRALGEGCRMNVTLILDSPEQKFLSANPPEGGDPDFHQPALWSRIEMRSGESL